MSLTSYSNESGGYVLHAYGRAIGWIEGRGIGFGGYASTGDALAAALAAHAALQGWVARVLMGEISPHPSAEITVRPDGPHEWMLLDGRPIGRLIWPGAAPLHVDGPAFGFELFLPRHVDATGALGIAQVIYEAIMEPKKPESGDGGPPIAPRPDDPGPAVTEPVM